MNRLYFVLLILIAGCKTEEEANIDKLTEAIRQHYENNAFRANKKIDLLEIEEVSYKLIGEARLDTIKSNGTWARVKYYTNLTHEYNQDISEEINRMALAKEAGSKALFDSHRLEVHRQTDKLYAFLDSTKYFLRQDTIIKQRIDWSKKQNNQYFDTRFFCKATIGGHNTLDTLYFVFDRNFKFVDTWQ